VRKEKLAVLGQVAGSVGHELRNPMGVMSNAVYFLQTVLADADDVVKEYLDIIKNEIAGSDVSCPTCWTRCAPGPPNPENSGRARDRRADTAQAHATAHCAGQDGHPGNTAALRGDAQQIHQVLRNLISNGAEAMPDGGTLDIRARADEAKKTVTISVQDSGVGMTPEQMGKLFQRCTPPRPAASGLGWWW